MVSHPQAANECNEAQAAGFWALDQLRQCVVERIRAGKFSDLDVDTASQALWGEIHDVTSLLIANNNFLFVAQANLVSMVTDTMVKRLEA